MGVSLYQQLIFAKQQAPFFVFQLPKMELPGAFGLSFIRLSVRKASWRLRSQIQNTNQIMGEMNAELLN